MTGMKLLFVMDPLARLQIAGDTTFAIMLAAQAPDTFRWSTPTPSPAPGR
jgi:hypothetical protein